MQDNSSPVPKITISRARAIILAIVFCVGSFAVGYSLAADGYRISAKRANITIDRKNPQRYSDVDFNMFWQVWDVLESSYFDKDNLDRAEMVWGAVRGMVAAAGDPYTVFLTPEENKVTQEDLQGNFEGIGIQIGFIGSQLAVVAPLVGSPAEEAGIRAGDIIAGIKDDSKNIDIGTAGITLPEAVKIIRGPAGTKIMLSLLREGENGIKRIEVMRREINVPSVRLSFVGEDENIAHLQVLRFGGETLKEWNDAVLELLRNQNLSGIILDLRNNPGGYLQGSVDLASEFLNNGDVVVVEQYSNGSKTEFLVERQGRLVRDNIVVLVNGGSASASEILAGALRDNKRSLVLGEPTFGKGTIQESKQLEGGLGLHITVARWLTPSGFWVNEGGIMPDVEVADDPETIEDEQLEKAISEISAL